MASSEFPWPISKLPISQNLINSKSKSRIGLYVSSPFEAKRIESGPNLVPGRKLVLVSKGQPKRTILELSYFF